MSNAYIGTAFHSIESSKMCILHQLNFSCVISYLLLPFASPLSSFCLSFMLFYIIFFPVFHQQQKCYERKKQTHTHTLGAKRVYLVCEKKKWNQMTGSKTRISSRHSLDGTCIFCSMHDFWVWFLVVPNNNNQQIWLNWTVGYCSLFHRCCFFHSLVFVNHRLKTKYDRKYDLNER